jgi:hypothetical protein
MEVTQVAHASRGLPISIRRHLSMAGPRMPKLKRRRHEHEPSRRPPMPILKMAMMMCSTFRLFHSSHTQKPMPTPPVSISAATITSQATPMDRRTPVIM